MDPYNSADTNDQIRAAMIKTAAANPYAAPQADIEDDVEVYDLEGMKASRGERLGAVIIDTAAYFVACIPLFLTTTLADKDGFAANALSVLTLLLLVGVFIYNLLLLRSNGQTIGKKVKKIKIVRTDGSEAGLGRIFGLRMLVPGMLGGIPYVGGLFTLINVLMIFGEERRCLHDQIADTIVIRDDF